MSLNEQQLAKLNKVQLDESWKYALSDFLLSPKMDQLKAFLLEEKKADKNAKRLQRHKRVRRKVFGTPQRPRLCVFRSSNNIYAQIIDDTNRVTLVAASSLDEAVKGAVNHTGNKEAAKLVGQLVAKKAVEKGITEVVFDRGGYLYHGRIKELAEAAREAGLKF